MIKLIIDSSSDFTIQEAQQEGMIFLPIELLWDGVIYQDGIDIYGDKFYEKLEESKSLPQTSQVKISLYQEIFDQICLDQDEAIVFTTSAKLSGCYQGAMLARNNRENIVIIDTETASYGEYILIKRAQTLIQEGKSLKQIQEILEQEKKDVVVLASLDTVEYLKKGGRLSSAVALVASLIKIKPILEIRDGEAVIAGKPRGLKKANNILDETIERIGGIDFDRPIAIGYSGSSKKRLEEYLEEGKEKYDPRFQSLKIHQAGSAIGTHTGPNALILGMFGKKRNV